MALIADLLALFKRHFMKLFTKIIAGTLFIGVTSVAIASTAELKLSGLITASACFVELDQPIIDFGDIPAKTLNVDRQTLLPRREVTLLVRCNKGSTKFSFSISDNRSTTVVNGANPFDALDESYLYGFGVSGAGNYGIAFRLNFNEGLLYSDNAGSSWEWIGNQNQAAIKPNGRRYTMAWDWNVPSHIYSMNFLMHIIPAIVKSSALDLSNPIPLDGSATFTFYYE